MSLPASLQGLRWTLASASPRRLELLRLVGIEPDILPSHAEEMERGEPAAVAQGNAVRKLDAVLPELAGGLVLAADTVVTPGGGELLGKPDSDAEAIAMLERLAGCEHEVITGVSLAWVEAERRQDFFVSTRVTMRPLAREEIEAYVATGQSRDKAGAYGIQGGAAAFVERVQGCYFTVVGLPLARVLQTAREWAVAETDAQWGSS